MSWHLSDAEHPQRSKCTHVKGAHMGSSVEAAKPEMQKEETGTRLADWGIHEAQLSMAVRTEAGGSQHLEPRSLLRT